MNFVPNLTKFNFYSIPGFISYFPHTCLYQSTYLKGSTGSVEPLPVVVDVFLLLDGESQPRIRVGGPPVLVVHVNDLPCVLIDAPLPAERQVPRDLQTNIKIKIGLRPTINFCILVVFQSLFKFQHRFSIVRAQHFFFFQYIILIWQNFNANDKKQKENFITTSGEVST